MALAQLLLEQNFPAIAIHRHMTQEERSVFLTFGFTHFCDGLGSTCMQWKYPPFLVAVSFLKWSKILVRECFKNLF
jgi:hypothetical protein